MTPTPYSTYRSYRSSGRRPGYRRGRGPAPGWPSPSRRCWPWSAPGWSQPSCSARWGCTCRGAAGAGLRRRPAAALEGAASGVRARAGGAAHGGGAPPAPAPAQIGGPAGSAQVGAQPAVGRRRPQRSNRRRPPRASRWRCRRRRRVPAAPAVARSAGLAPAPASFRLNGFRHQWQTWNNCGPATITMAVSVFGRAQDQTGRHELHEDHPERQECAPGRDGGLRPLARPAGGLAGGGRPGPAEAVPGQRHPGGGGGELPPGAQRLDGPLPAAGGLRRRRRGASPPTTA